LQRPSWFVCEQCGHVVIPDDPDFKCSCRRCTWINGLLDVMSTREEHILRILHEEFPYETTRGLITRSSQIQRAHDREL
jgi:hypothetical protein